MMTIIRTIYKTIDNNKYVHFILCLGLISFLLILPDIIFSLVNDNFKISTNYYSLLFIVSLAILFVINKSKAFLGILIGFFSIIQVGQFCHIKYFGVLISQASLFLLTKEVSDVAEESTAVFGQYIYIFFLVLVPFLAIYKLALSRYLKRYKLKSYYTIAMILFIILPQIFLVEERGPNAVNFSLENSIRAIDGVIEIFTKNHNFKDYKPYRVEKNKDITEATTIVYIMGESTNADYMSLFGYEEDTTPRLKELAAKSSDFYYTRGIAGGITTISSCKFMCNAIREPDNIKETALDTVNLFKLAKTSGFKTFYISSKRGYMLAPVGGMAYIDVMITKEQYPTQFSTKRDTFLLELISKQTFSDKNFIVVHQRCIHSPYKKTIPQSFIASKKFTSNSDDRINDYVNAILYNDFVISELFNIFNKFKGKFYIFWASDHNELIGKKGLWGHGILDASVAEIPILIQSNDKEFMRDIKNIFAITHNDICCAIANLIGFKIINPNEEKDIYYIDGVDYIGRCGFIKFKKDSVNKRIEFIESK